MSSGYHPHPQRIETAPSGTIVIRGARADEMPSVVETAVAAFTTFDVFGPPWWADAGILPAALAALPSNDHALSRVAVEGSTGAILGHAQWNLCRMFLAGRERDAACLAPLSVIPSRQGKGIGALLARDGIELLRSIGTEVLLVLGHETYYPRFGFVPGCLGYRGTLVGLPPRLAADPEGYGLRPLACGDERACLRLWRDQFEGVDGSLPPGPGLLPWASKTKGIVSCTLEREGIAVGHARFDSRPDAVPDSAVLRFLAADEEAAAVLLGRIAAWCGWEVEAIRLPLPHERAPRLFADARPAHEWWAGGMAMPLGPDPAAASALASVASKRAPPLAVEWPPLFDF